MCGRYRELGADDVDFGSGGPAEHPSGGLKVWRRTAAAAVLLLRVATWLAAPSHSSLRSASLRSC